MNSELCIALSERLHKRVKCAKRLRGGDINDAYHVTLQDGTTAFVKTHPNPPKGMFEAEARGLAWLGEAHAIRIPGVVAVSEEPPAYLALELIASAKRQPEFDAVLGRSLAALHEFGAPSFGHDRDGFIGSLPQVNTASGDWADFYRSARLEPQLRWAVDRGLVDSRTQKSFDALFLVLEDRVGVCEPPCRLHGDLWSGNLHVDEAGLPVLIDPAAYGGHREVDLAMMRLFGGFSERVFHAYEEAWPLAPGASERVSLYQLYPLLVHLNLFGGSYAGPLKRALDKYA